ncbi:DNA-formamidopyrimidine glycosylase [Oscillatoria sp. FACHB-1407]|uniref:DNA-formamidopyrimidine glycosylase n=1 Tax=Oscillatoria sp. FACHB-1407 TaxID=2692847 RepID=UPI0016881D34|nr:DNA-formamidopyrimidine glycosylase [Oscillatoria sp. FACHB-1407]MBD2460382.1 DNA-formamidopyrimidine glycosylase [Oscillatoria sp. FACHB-1407]
MPELPEVETVRRGLNQVTLGQTIQGGDVLLDRTIAHPISLVDFLEGVKGTAIAQWHRRGKYLLAELVPAEASLNSTPLMKGGRGDQFDPASTHSSGGWLGAHLRMTGQLLWLSQTSPLQKHCRVRLFFENDQELRFVDQRTFGQMWWIPPELTPNQVMLGLARLGPEPLSAAFSVNYFTQQLKGRDRPIKNALLDQTIVAGIGNIYADEALFLSGIQPKTLCSQLKPRHIQKLHAAILQVLQTAIASRGTTFSDFRDVEGINGNYGHVAWVYDREGEPCRVCETPILRIKLAGRSAHYCERCQSKGR